ncbi:MAG: hypothetical protein GY703_01700 [Gammaproteobacteria bacterium]|nr:hypothetical protein [Gammaproteobacteria bacterium]
MSGFQRVIGIVGLCGLLGISAGTVYSADESQSEQRKYYVEDIKSTMMEHIRSTVDDKGIFYMHDDKTNEKLALKFVRIHDPVRQIGSDIYFACTDFEVVGEEGKLYDLDFWMNDKTGELRIYQSKVHKEPRWSLLYGWYKQPRYTFVNDEIKYLY